MILLREREIYVLQQRKEKTLDNIGFDVGLCGNRIKEIERRALGKLKDRINVMKKMRLDIRFEMEYDFFEYLSNNDLMHCYDVENDTIVKSLKTKRILWIRDE